MNTAISLSTLKRFVTLTFFIFSFVMLMQAQQPQITSYLPNATGTGTQADPYTCDISSALDMVNLSKYIAAMHQNNTSGTSLMPFFNLTVTDDIVLPTTFLPIGKKKCTFNGTFDGGNHTITMDMDIDSVSILTVNHYSGYGLFGDVNLVTIKNLVLDGNMVVSNVIGGQHVANTVAAFAGCFIGRVNDYSSKGVSRIENCTNKCNLTINVSASFSSGGFVGCVEQDSVFFDHCYNSATITANKILTGNATSTAAFIGKTARSKTKINFSYCYNIGNVISNGARAHAFVAWRSSGTMYYYNTFTSNTITSTAIGGYLSVGVYQPTGPAADLCQSRNAYSAYPGTQTDTSSSYHWRMMGITPAALTSGELTYWLNQYNTVSPAAWSIKQTNQPPATPGGYWMQGEHSPVYNDGNHPSSVIRCKFVFEFPNNSNLNHTLYFPVDSTITFPYQNIKFIRQGGGNPIYFSSDSYTTTNNDTGEVTFLCYEQGHFDLSIIVENNTLTPVLKYKNNTESNGTLFVPLDPLLPGDVDSTYTVSYEWFHQVGNDFDTTTNLTFNNSQLYRLIATLACGNTNNITITTFFGTSHVVYISQYGNDSNSGIFVTKPVKTFRRAYSILRSAEDGGSVSNNHIYLLDNISDNCLYSDNEADYNNFKTIFNKPATISTHQGLPIARIALYSESNTPFSGNFLFADTKFDSVIFNGGDKKVLFFYCQGHNLTIGSNVSYINYNNIVASYSNGAIVMSAAIPNITILGGWLVYGNNDETIPDDTVSINISSGRYGRVVLGSRSVSGSPMLVMGSPTQPYKVKLTLSGESTYVNTIVGGQTDGSCFMESTINVRGGTYGRIVGGTIGYRREVLNEPDNTYFGRVVVNMSGGSVKELYGGSLGRGMINCYFYGTITLNISGTAVVSSAIYGGGAGGVVGNGGNGIYNSHQDKANQESNCVLIDYGTASYVVGDEKNGDYINNFISSFPQGEGEKIEINISGGTITGNVYGGGYGFSDYVFYGTKDFKMDPENLLQSIQSFSGLTGSGITQPFGIRVPRDVGGVYCPCHINISGGTINGNVYGGARGTNLYQKIFNIVRNTFPSSTVDVVKDDNENAFLYEIAQMYNNVYVDISGGVVNGNVYGSGEGVSEVTYDKDGNVVSFEKTACVNGNVEVRIRDGAKINGSVFGGGQSGMVVGNTSVYITGQNTEISNDVFGGGDKAMVKGSTYVRVGSNE